jgi:integrase
MPRWLDAPANRAPIFTAAYCGLRAGELGYLHVESLDLLRGRLEVRGSLAEFGGCIVEGRRFHDLRHICAALLIASGRISRRSRSMSDTRRSARERRFRNESGGPGGPA